MYYEYWGMNRHPFDNVPDPTMYFRAHESVETAVAEVLFAIEEGDEVLAVIVGEVGLGKTTSLRVILDSLEQDKYRIAFVTNPDVSFTMLLREMIGQLRGKTCEVRRKDDLLEEFNRVLFETADEGRRVLIFIDEGNAFKPMNLESLRLLTNMQEDNRNLFTIVLAGQPKLARMLEAPGRSNLFQRIGVYCKLKKMESWQMVKDYVEHRLERAGASRQVFSDEAIKAVFQYSEEGIPRLINKICKLALKAGETNGVETIGPEIVAAIGQRFQRAIRPACKEDEAAAKPEAKPKKTRKGKAKAEPAEGGNGNGHADEHVETPEPEAVETASETAYKPIEPMDTPLRAAAELAMPLPASDLPPKSDSRIGFYGSGMARVRTESLDFTDKASFYPDEEQLKAEAPPESIEETVTAEHVCLDDVLRPDILEKARSASKLERMKMAGQLAAEEIKKHPEVVSHAGDPVVMWKELRNEILTAFAAEVNS